MGSVRIGFPASTTYLSLMRVFSYHTQVHTCIHTPRTYRTHTPRTYHTPHTPHIPHTPRTPHTPHIPHTPHTPHIPHTPHTTHIPHTAHTQLTTCTYTCVHRHVHLHIYTHTYCISSHATTSIFVYTGTYKSLQACTHPHTCTPAMRTHLV